LPKLANASRKQLRRLPKQLKSCQKTGSGNQDCAKKTGQAIKNAAVKTGKAIKVAGAKINNAIKDTGVAIKYKLTVAKSVYGLSVTMTKRQKWIKGHWRKHDQIVVKPGWETIPDRAITPDRVTIW
jgi:hypothetical protein